MTGRKFRHGSNFAIATLSLLVILVVVNIFSSRHFIRWDLTENKEHTVSRTTRDILGNLNDVVNVSVYLSKNLPAELLLFERQLRDVLSEYESYGGGKLRIKYVSPGDDRQLQQELMILGVRPQPVAVFKRDRSTRVGVYNSIVIQYQDRREVIPSLLDEGGELVSDFEYLLTSRIFKVQRPGRRVIGWLTNASDIKLDEDYRSLRELVRKEWDVRDIRIDPPMRIAQDIAVLVVISPRDFTDAQLFEIDQYLMRGGKILALVDTYDRRIRNRGLEALVSRPTNFTKMLEHYGLKVNDEIVMDRYCARAPITRFAAARYEFWVNILRAGFNRENPIVSRLDLITLPWPQTLDQATSMPEGVEMTWLARTSPYSLVRWGTRISPDPRMPTDKQSKKGKSRIVAAILRGTFPSYFPQGTPYPLDEGTTQPKPGRTRENERKYVSPETQIAVVANAMFLQDNFLRMLSAGFNAHHNMSFFMNTIEWLALGKGLSEIRARQAIGRRIKANIPDWKRTAYKVFGTFTMPVVVIVAGVVYNTVRRRRRRSIARRVLAK